MRTNSPDEPASGCLERTAVSKKGVLTTLDGDQHPVGDGDTA